MKTLLLIPMLGFGSLYATNFNITISGTTYTPDKIVVQLNDVVSIEASSAHPLVQVSKATWDASLTTELAGGWGTKTANYQFTITKTDTIYFVCQNHASLGMKGMIVVDAVNGVSKAEKPSAWFIANPAQNQKITISNPQSQTLEVQIFGVSGAQVRTLTVVDLHAEILIPSGIYFARITDPAGVIRREKIIVE